MDVEQHQVDRSLSDNLDRLFTATCLDESGMRLKHRADGFPKPGIVVSNQQFVRIGPMRHHAFFLTAVESVGNLKTGHRLLPLPHRASGAGDGWWDDPGQSRRISPWTPIPGVDSGEVPP